MTDEHKDALARGRNASRAVRAYLEALEQSRPRRGRKRTLETVQRQLDEASAQMPETSGIRRLELIQRQLDLTSELAALSEGVDLHELERSFVEHAVAYAESKGITYDAFRSFGVPPDLLREAGLRR